MLQRDRRPEESEPPRNSGRTMRIAPPGQERFRQIDGMLLALLRRDGECPAQRPAELGLPHQIGFDGAPLHPQTIAAACRIAAETRLAETAAQPGTLPARAGDTKIEQCRNGLARAVAITPAQPRPT